MAQKKGVRSATELKIKLWTGFEEVINLVRDEGKRTPGQIQAVREAMQALIENKHFKIQEITLRELLLSKDPEDLAEGWEALYHKWGMHWVRVPPFPRRYIKHLENLVPIYIDERTNPIYLEEVLHVVFGHSYALRRPECTGWHMISLSPEAPLFIPVSHKTNSEFTDMNLLAFSIFCILAQEIYPDCTFEQEQYELLPHSYLFKNNNVVYITYYSFGHFEIHHFDFIDDLPPVRIGCRTLIKCV